MNGPARSILELAAEQCRQRAGHARTWLGEQPRERNRASAGQDHVGAHAAQSDHGFALDRHAAPVQPGHLLGIRFEDAVEEEGGRSPVGQHQGVVDGQRRGRQYANRPTVQFVAVAIRAMEHVPAPALRKTGDLRQVVGYPAGEDQPACGEAFSVGGLHHETVSLLLRRDGGFGQPLDAGIGQQLCAGVIGDGRRIAAVLAEKAMGGPGEAVASQARIHHQHPAPRPRQLHARGDAGIAAAHDDHVESHGVSPIRIVMKQHKFHDMGLSTLS
ncbi:Uncharacterised protein [Pseudomonas aeruginosa]|nr:Uncharacterised protein [Pseudomonas aeruginosa]